jgi:signal transduction histidine kinase
MRFVRILETGTIRSRLMGALVLLAAIPVLVLVVSLYLLGRMSGDARRIELAASLRMGSYAVAARLEHHLSSPDPRDAHLVAQELARMDQTLAALEAGSQGQGIAPVRDASSRERIEATRAALVAYRELVQRVLDEVAGGGPPLEQRDERGHEILVAAQDMLVATQRMVLELEARTAAALRQVWILQAAAVLVALAVLAITLWAVNRYILQAAPPLREAMGRVAAGQYDVRVEVRGENELSRVAEGFNAMSRELERAHHALVMQQADIREKNAELERANALKSQFVANMSHELRTPLHAVIGYTKLLRSGAYGQLPATIEAPLQGIDETSTALLRLINDILDVAKIEAGKTELRLASFDVAEVVREVGAMLRPLALGKGLDLAVRADLAVPNLTSDREKVRRVLLNLAGNAIKFTRRGRVHIELRPVVPGDPENGAGGHVEIAVRDTGIGIAPENLELVFEDFRQIDGSATREHGGTGLGLAIGRRLARQLGGDIQVESRLGSGSTFTLQLPIARQVDSPNGCRR